MAESRSASRGNPIRKRFGAAEMRIAFLIRRKNYYRPLAPVVEEALRRGYQVECWHDWSQPRTGMKASEFPDEAPVYRSGSPGIRNFKGLVDLAERWRAEPPDAVLSLEPPPPGVKETT